MANKARRELAAGVNETGAFTGWPGGRGVFMVEASAWNGGFVEIEAQSPRSTPIPLQGTRVTENLTVLFEFPPGQIRVSIAGATGVYAWAVTVGD